MHQRQNVFIAGIQRAVAAGNGGAIASAGATAPPGRGDGAGLPPALPRGAVPGRNRLRTMSTAQVTGVACLGWLRSVYPFKQIQKINPAVSL